MLLGASRGECAGRGWGDLDIRIRYQSNTTAYTYTHEIPTMFTTHYSTQRHYSSHILRFFPLLLQCRTPYAVVHGLVLLMMGIMMPETCWDRSLIINIRLVASCWFLSLHPTFMMHGHKNLKQSKLFISCHFWKMEGSTAITGIAICSESRFMHFSSMYCWQY